MDGIELRSERIEFEALRSLHANCPEATREALGLSLDDIGGVLVAGAANDPSILLNRALGLGVEEAAGADIVRSVMAAYTRHGIEKYFLHVYQDALTEGTGAQLPQLGLEPARGWRKFRRGMEAPPPARSELRVERVGADRASHFGRIVATAFGMTDAAAPLLAGLVSDSRWHLYVSYAGDTPAGAGALMVDGKDAWCEWGATDPAFRRQGSQGAIMAARLQAAIDAGCEYVFTETGEAADDDPQHSYRNIERYGFTAGALRENWRPV